jgi:hypothetical protein
MFHAAGASSMIRALRASTTSRVCLPGYPAPRAELEGTALARRAGARYWLLPHQLEVDLQRHC